MEKRQLTEKGKCDAEDRVEQLCLTALGLDPSRRESFLAEACAGNEALYREVLSLLSYQVQAEGFLEQPVFDLARALLSSPPPRFARGQRVGGYEILDTLGHGGMGEVFLARDLRLLHKVAIKVLPDVPGGDPERTARFVREAQIHAMLNHDRIARVYDLKEWEGGWFLVLEYVPGETLAEPLQSGPLPVADALALFAQLADALAYAHAQKVIHRDFKPANIKITPGERVKVLDFGIAKYTRRTADDESTMVPSTGQLTRITDLTQPNSSLGTPAYMSPEQVRREPTDERTDLWAFGVVLFEALAGRHPFRRETREETMAAILRDAPEWSALPADVPVRVVRLLRRCLEKDAAARLADADEARREIEAAQAEPAAPPLRPPLSRQWWWHWRRVALIAVVIALLVAAALLYNRPVIPERKQVAIVAFSQVSRESPDPVLSIGAAELLSERLCTAAGLQVISPADAAKSASAGGAHNVASADADQQWLVRGLGANLVLRGTIERAGGRAALGYTLANAEGQTIGGGKVEGASLLGVIEQAAARVAKKLGVSLRPAAGLKGDDPTAETRYLQALGYLQQSTDEAAVDKAIELLEKLDLTGSESALVSAALGRAYLFKYVLTRDQSYTGRAVAACNKALNFVPDLVEVQVTLGLVRGRLGLLQEAASSLERARTARPDDYNAWLGLGWVYQTAGRSAEAEAAFRQAIQLRPHYWLGYNELGRLYAEQGQYAQAAENFGRVVAALPDSVEGQNNLGAVYLAQGDFERAAQSFRASLSVRPTPDAHSNLGTALYYLKHYDAAAAEYERAAGLRPKDADLWGNLGDARRWSTSGQAQTAAAFDEAIRLREAELQVNASDAEALARLAEWQAKRGYSVEAEKRIAEALRATPDNVNCLASAVVVYYLLGRREPALKFRQLAINKGYGAELFERDPWLAALR